jgi:hypothetical protein
MSAQPLPIPLPMPVTSATLPPKRFDNICGSKAGWKVQCSTSPSVTIIIYSDASNAGVR